MNGGHRRIRPLLLVVLAILGFTSISAVWGMPTSRQTALQAPLPATAIFSETAAPTMDTGRTAVATAVVTLEPTASPAITPTADITTTATVERTPPPWPTFPPWPTAEPTGAPTDMPTATDEPTGTPTATVELTPPPWPTFPPWPTAEPTGAPTDEPTGTPTATDEPTGTPTATDEPTGTPTATACPLTPTAPPATAFLPPPPQRNTPVCGPTPTTSPTPRATSTPTSTPTPTRTPTPTPKPEPPKVLVSLVDFKTTVDVIRDRVGRDGHQKIGEFEDKCKEKDSAEWKDCDPKDWPDTKTEKNWPVAYVKDSQVTLNKVILKVKAQPPLKNVTIVGTAKLGDAGNGDAGTLTFEQAGLNQTANNTLEMTNPTYTGKLPNYVTSFKSMTITWQVKYKDKDGKDQVIDAGSSSHIVYVLRATPTKDVYLTIADFTTERARGKSTEADVASKIWEEFKGPTEKPLRAMQRRDLDPVTGTITKGDKLQYYPSDWTLEKWVLGQYARPGAANTSQLLRDKIGWCLTWADFFVHSLGVHGIAAKIYQIAPPKGVENGAPVDGTEILPTAPKDAEWMLVKTWTFSNKPTGAGVYPYLLQFTVNNGMVVYTKKEVEYDGTTALPGQNNANPQALFKNHAIVYYNKQWYDPSYGGGSFADLTAWEKAALSGYLQPNGTAACKLQFPAQGNPSCGK